MRVPAYPPTSQPQTCRTCSCRLLASHFSVDMCNRTGRKTRCRACVHDYELRRQAALPPRMTAASKECPDCGETKPAADFFRCYCNKDGLQVYCRPCNAARSRSRGKLRAPPQQLPPPKLLCGGPCGEVKPITAFSQQASGSLFGVGSMCKTCKQEARKLRSAAQKAAAGRHAREAGGASGFAGGGAGSGGSDSGTGGASPS